MMEEKKIIFKLDEISKIYHSNKVDLQALDEICCEIYDSEIISIMGKSGSGKSTLLNIISTVDKPTTGSVKYKDKYIEKLDERDAAKLRLNEFGFVYQKFNLIPTLNVYDNICMPVTFSKKKPDYEYIDTLAKDLGIDNLYKKMPGQLSGGEQQRVAIARALAHKPVVVFADEPTGNLDSENGNNVINLLINNAKKYKQTVVYVTHDKELANKADRVFYIKDGKVVSNEVDKETK